MRKSNYDVQRLLLAKGADINAISFSGATAMHSIALKYTDLRLANLLLKLGFPVDSLNVKGGEYPAVLIATSDNPTDIRLLKLLIAYGADVSIRSVSSGKTALDYARQNKNTEAETLILNALNGVRPALADSASPFPDGRMHAT